MYPIVMILANIVMIAYLMISLIPKMQKVFSSLRTPLPWYTQVIIGTSEFLQKFWYTVPIVIGLIVWLFLKWVNTEKGRRKFDETCLKLPIFGGLLLRMQVSRFTQTLSTLLASGVPIIRALEITKNIISNTVIAEVLENAKTAVQEGKNLGQTIEKSGRFPPLVTHMIMTGERTGQLEEMLGHVAVGYEAEVQRKIESMISLIEPAMIIISAGSVGGIVAAVLGPMLSIMNQIR
jgi:general secretion pathway protein F